MTEFSKELKDVCDNTALHIFSLADMKKWPGWIQYILERIDAMDANSEPGEVDYDPGDIDFAWVLEKVKEGIETRLREGVW